MKRLDKLTQRVQAVANTEIEDTDVLFYYLLGNEDGTRPKPPNYDDWYKKHMKGAQNEKN